MRSRHKLLITELAFKAAIAIPTYCREQVLIETVHAVLKDLPNECEVLVVDQTPVHTPAVAAELDNLENKGRIRRLMLPAPSITHAMNTALMRTEAEIVIFLDDDIRPEPGLVAAHLAAHRTHAADVVAGRVIQPWQERQDFSNDASFHFASLRPCWIDDFMGGNFSVRRDVALALGGFDENFVRVAYRFEAEFAHRLRHAGHRIWFEPGACIHHLKAAAGGTRSFGDHLTTLKPHHAVGAYYFVLQTSSGAARFAELAKRFVRSILTHHHLARPWWIPVTLASEMSGLIWAMMLAARGPRYVDRA